jgi:hypothetical protein
LGQNCVGATDPRYKKTRFAGSSMPEEGLEPPTRGL